MKCHVCKDRDGRGKRNICRKCWEKEYRQRKKEHIRQVSHKKYMRNRKRSYEAVRKWKSDPKNMAKVNKFRKEYYYKNKEIALIRARTRREFGHLKKEGKCEICDSRENLEFHHEPPFSFDNFRLLCKYCHLAVDKELNLKNWYVNSELNEGEKE